jgi:hypothetical protein
MSLTDDVVDWMRDEITWEQRTGVGIHGEPVFADAVTLKGRVVGQQRLVPSASGQLVLSSTTIHLHADALVTDHDRVTLPAPWAPRTPKILAVRRTTDDTGARVVTVYT